MFQCIKCKKSFSTKAGLKQHEKRKTPCDSIKDFSCARCNKSFSTKAGLKQHEKRKTLCKLEKENSPSAGYKFSFEEEIKIKEKDLEIFKEKKKIELEIIKAKKEAYRENLMDRANSQSIIEKAKREAYKESLMDRTDSQLIIEKAKTDRKKQTSQIINNTMININIQELKILNKCPPINIIDATTDCLNKITKCITYGTSDKNIIEIAFKNGDINSVSIHLIKKTYNNDEYPDQKNMIYSDSSNTFYAVKDGEWKETEFESLKEIISKTLHNYYKKLCKKTTGLSIEDDNKEIYDKLKERKVYGCPEEELEDIAKKALTLQIK